MIKTFHEAPKAIFKEVQQHTDGDYALVHLFKEDPEYLQLFKDAVAEGREVILDNSVFELGEAFNSDLFAYWVRKIKPTWYIVPDVLEDCTATIATFFTFIEQYPDLPGKRIGVAQGNSYEEMVRCYQAIEPYCDMVAISFDYSWFQTGGNTKEMNAMQGRRCYLKLMVEQGIINRNKPHHLLGCMLPQEFLFYTHPDNAHMFEWIYSTDTSNPVVHGLKSIRYETLGLRRKESQKLYTMINEPVTATQRRDILFNISRFRRYCSDKLV